MREVYQSLSHSKWDCKVPCDLRAEAVSESATVGSEPRQQLKAIFHEMARQKECQILEGHLMPDHVHMVITIPPKYVVSAVIGFPKGKSAIAVARLQGKERSFSGEHLWARGYTVSTVGFELAEAQRYVREQDDADEAGRFGAEPLLTRFYHSRKSVNPDDRL